MKYFNFTLLFGYIVFILLALFISLLESFSYSGFFLKHFHLSLDFFIYVSLVCGLVICVIPADLIKSRRWVKFVKNFFLLNVNAFFMLLLVILVVNVLEYINYSNFVYSHVHLQPKLLFKTGFLQMFFLQTNLWHIIRLGGYKSNFMSIKSVQVFAALSLLRFHLQTEKNYRIAVSRIQGYILLTYSVVILIFALTSSVKFVNEFYKADKAFLQENELKYAQKTMDIYHWVEEFFPKTKDIIRWCDQQDKPVELVTFDPEMMWMNYEGLSRVFLTNCYIANIDSLNKSHSYVGKDNLLLVSIASCDHELDENKSDPNGDHLEYFKVVNNQHICRSREIVPGLYLYKGGEAY